MTIDLDAETLTLHEREKLGRWLTRAKDREIAEETGSSRQTLLRAALGLEVRRGSIALIRAGLSRVNP